MFKIYFNINSSGYPYENSIYVSNDTTFTMTNLSLSTTYNIVTAAYDLDGNESWYSYEVVGITRTLQVQNLNIGANYQQNIAKVFMLNIVAQDVIIKFVNQ